MVFFEMKRHLMAVLSHPSFLPIHAIHFLYILKSTIFTELIGI